MRTLRTAIARVNMTIPSEMFSSKNIFRGFILLVLFPIFFKYPGNISWDTLVEVVLYVATFAILYMGVKLSFCVISYAIDYFTDSITVFGEVTNTQSNPYRHILFLIGDQLESKPHKMPYNTQKCEINNLETAKGNFCKVPKLDDEDWEYGEISRNTPSFGYHIFKYDGKRVLLHRQLQRHISYRGSTGESITLRTIYKDRDILQKIVNSILPVNEKPKKGTTRILNYLANHGCWQDSRTPVQKRNIDTVILQEDYMETMMKDIKSYLTKGKWYADRGIPHRRGYLLYGPPGNGKSSCVRAIAAEIDCTICILSLNAPGLTDDDLNSAMNQTPENSIILLEDIDAAFQSRQDEKATAKETNLAYEGNGQSKITFRGLLNALDGVGSMEGRLTIMTSNHADKLDPALIRPGRVDMKLLINYPDEKQIRRMFNRFFPKENYESKEYMEIENELIRKIQKVTQSVSMSMIQGLFIIYTESPQTVIDNVDDYFTNLCSSFNPI